MQGTIIYAITAGSIFILCLSLLATPRKVNVNANYWLSLFLLSFGCILLNWVLTDTNVYEEYPVFMPVLEITRFAMSPALYFSVVYFTEPERRFSRTDYLHFLPFAIFLFFIFTVITGLNKTFLFSWFGNLPEGLKQGIGLVVFLSVKIQMFLYWILSFVRLVRHTRNIRLFASTTNPVSLWWLRYFLLGVAGGLLLSVNEAMLVPDLVPLTPWGYLLITFYLGYFSIRQQEIFPYPSKDIKEIQDIIEQTSTSSRIPEDMVVSAKRKLIRIMETEKVFLDPNLGLPQLAAKVQMSTHDLSFLINTGLGENFFQFVNRYRVEEAKILLKSDQHKHLNILGIAYESGFRSKSTFNTTFKKLTGLSPSQFAQSTTDEEKDQNLQKYV